MFAKHSISRISNRRPNVAPRQWLTLGLILLSSTLAACNLSATAPATLAGPSETAVFPSDRHTVPDATTLTGKRLSLGAFQEDRLFVKFGGMRDDLESLDGFGTTSPLYIRFADSPSLANLPTPALSTAATSPIRLFSLETGAPQSFRWHYEPSIRTLFITPVQALVPQRRYALVAAGLEAHNGERYRARAFVDPLPDALPDADPAALQVRAVFTTQSIHGGLLAAVDETELVHGPDEFPTRSDECGDASHIGYFGAGFLKSTDYRTENGRFPRSFDDKSPRRDGKNALIPYLFTLPKNATRAPVMLLQHGLMGMKEQTSRCWAINEYAKQGFATIAIDAVLHGERGEGERDATILDNFHMFFGLSGDGDGYLGEFRFARDSLRQTTLDHHELVRLVRQMAQALDVTVATEGTPDGIPDVSTDVFYYGASMGGIIGSVTFAVVGDLQGASLNVPGGRLHNMALESGLGLIDLFLRPALAGGEFPDGEIRRLLGYYQTIVERAEPLNYAPHWWKSPLPGRTPRSVIIQESIDDNTVPNFATVELSLAGELPLMTPALVPPPGMSTVAVPASGLAENLAPGVAGGMSQYDYVIRGGSRNRAMHATMGSFEPAAQTTKLFRSILDGTPTIFRAYENEAK